MPNILYVIRFPVSCTRSVYDSISMLH